MEDEDYQDGFDNEPPELTSSSAYATIPQWLHMSGISDRAFRIYCILAQMQGSRGNDAYPSKATLMRMTRSSKMSVIRAMKELETCGAITSIERFRKDGGQMSSSYVLHYDNKVIQSTMGRWTDEPPLYPRVAPRGPEGLMGETLGGLMGATHKKNHIEKEPEKKVVASASPTARKRGQPRPFSDADRTALHEKWGAKVKNLDAIIESAMNHSASLKAINTKTYVDGWIRRDYERRPDIRLATKRGIPDSGHKISAADWDAD